MSIVTVLEGSRSVQPALGSGERAVERRPGRRVSQANSVAEIPTDGSCLGDLAIVRVDCLARSLLVLRASAVAMVVALVLFPAVTRLRQIGVPQNPASFSGVHRSGVVPPGPELVVPQDSRHLVRPELVTHPADCIEVRHEALVTAVPANTGLRAPPAVLA